jgi:ATP-dependent Lon protease
MERRFALETVPLPMTTRRIALFPLNVVLFPGNALPLHIFESRYKLMISEILNAQEPFGIILAREHEIATIGCTAVVDRVLRTYADGRIDLVTHGKAPYRVRAVHNDKAYLEGTVELLTEDPQPGLPGIAEELRTLFTDCHLLLHGTPPSSIEEKPDASLAYRVAGELPLDVDVLQELLEMRVEVERQAKLIERLNHLLPQLVQIQQMRSKAVDNGHGPN